MQKEITDIIKAYHQAVKDNKKTALATVVKVEGSSYRRPGARMLITDDGRLTGAISGGCLEGDALRKALLAIIQQENKLVTYDTTDEDDAKFGVQLGCNGIVHILFQPINGNEPFNPIALLTELAGKREDAVLVTTFSLTGKNQPGTIMLLRKEDSFVKVSLGDDGIVPSAVKALEKKKSSFIDYNVNGETITCFIEFIRPSISLVIAGAGNDAQPLTEIAYLLGWEVSIVDGRPGHATPQRFPKAKKIQVLTPEQVLTHIKVDEQTAFVLMTHNYNYDLELLGQLLKTSVAYIGSLGPRTKLLRMLDELGQNTVENQQRIHGPVGLDIGAETAEEIAVSIVAEIKSVFMGTSAKPLKDKRAPVHFSPEKKAGTGIIILAAGSSSRMGKPKQLLTYKGKTLLERVVETALETPFRPVVVVLGANAAQIPKEQSNVIYKINTNWQEGMSSSISVGMSSMLNIHPDIEDVIIAVADQVFITTEIFESLLSAKHRSGKNIVASSYAQTKGTPVLFNKKYFQELLSLIGDQGAKPLLSQHPDDITSIDFGEGNIDIDTEADYLNLTERR